MGILRELSERLLSGAASTEGQHPFFLPLAVEEVAPRSAFVASLANVTVLDTDEGLVLLDVGGHLTAPLVHGAVRGWSTSPVAAAVYTHGHVDHVMGAALWDAEADAAGRPRPRVYAHRRVPARFERYRRTSGWQSCINGRQFSMAIRWPVEYRAPDELHDDARRLVVGGETIELHHARGETDDHTWAWVPSRKLLATGDLFIWCLPNAGNPQKVQRFPREWAAALREMERLGAEVLCPGHGPPIFGVAAVARALGETAALLEALAADVEARMNAGQRLDEILQAVKPPAELLERPYLRPVYDDPEFVVRALWRGDGGWWDGNPARLKPPGDAAVAREVAALSGGAARLMARAEEVAAAGDLRLACQLAEWARDAAPDDPAIRKARAALYRRRAAAEPSLMARGIFDAAADEP